MSGFRNIVVGLELASDGASITQGSAKASAQAIWVARVGGGRIRYVHSTYREPYFDADSGDVAVEDASLPASALALLEAEVAAARAEGVDASLELTTERMWRAITRLAQRREADLVVVGKRNAASTDGRKLGAAATKLLRKCPAAVWVVKPEHDLVHKLVLAASDLKPLGDEACRAAARIAQLQGCELHVVHAYQVSLALQSAFESSRISEGEYGERIEALRARAVAHVRASIAEVTREGEAAVEVHVGKGPPAQVIREAVAHLDPDLLVMGTISHVADAGSLVGSTAERLLDRLDCSILAVKPAEFEPTVG